MSGRTKELSVDQRWCLTRAEDAQARGAPTVAKLLRDAATHPSKAKICRQEMRRAARAVKSMKGELND